jgi:hypothetical protein
LALIRLDRDADMGSRQVSVLPVCLTQMVQVMPGDVVYAVGWGFTENSRNQGGKSSSSGCARKNLQFSIIFVFLTIWKPFLAKLIRVKAGCFL